VFGVKENVDSSINKYKSSTGSNPNRCLDFHETFSPVIKQVAI